MECVYEVKFSLPPRRRGFDPWPVHVRCVVNKVALELILLQVIRFVPVSIRHPMLHVQLRVINPYPTAFPYGNGMVLHFLPATREQHDQNCTQSH